MGDLTPEQGIGIRGKGGRRRFCRKSFRFAYGSSFDLVFNSLRTWGRNCIAKFLRGVTFEATGFDDGEEVPTEFGFGGGGEEEGDYNLSESCLQEGGQASTYAGGGVNTVDVDDAAGVPEFGEGFELGVEGGVAGAGPEFAVADEGTGAQ
jgi:hypothetical protein